MTEHKQGWFRAGEPAGDCLAVDELWLFSRSELTADRRDAVRDHLAGCVWCSEKIARLSDPSVLLNPTLESPPAELNRRVGRLWAVNPIRQIWRSQALWSILFLVSIGISFAVPRHYKQFLVIALVCGIRWALSERAGRSWVSISRIRSEETKEPGSSDRRLNRHLKP